MSVWSWQNWHRAVLSEVSRYAELLFWRRSRASWSTRGSLRIAASCWSWFHFKKNVFHCFTLPGSEGGRRGSWGGSGVRTLRAPCFEFAIFGNFCKRTLHLVLQYSTGRNSASGAKNKTQKFVDTEENGSKEVLQYVFLIKNRIYYHSYLAEIGVWRPPVFDWGRVMFRSCYWCKKYFPHFFRQKSKFIGHY